MHFPDHNRISTRLTIGAGAAGVLATGAVHLDEYTASGFSSVPTIGTLFMLNFIASIVIGAGLLLPLDRVLGSAASRVRTAFALGGIGFAASSLLGLWISEQSSLFGFTDHGTRPAILAAIAAELIAVVSLSAYVALEHGVRRLPRRSASA